jgi:hypothetical protein
MSANRRRRGWQQPSRPFLHFFSGGGAPLSQERDPEQDERPITTAPTPPARRSGNLFERPGRPFLRLPINVHE